MTFSLYFSKSQRLFSLRINGIAGIVKSGANNMNLSKVFYKLWKISIEEKKYFYLNYIMVLIINQLNNLNSQILISKRFPRLCSRGSVRGVELNEWLLFTVCCNPHVFFVFVCQFVEKCRVPN